MKTILTADWHLDDNSNNQYRWTFFPWLCELIIKEKVDRLILLGDITEKKDRHSSILVNKIADTIFDLTQLCKVVVLKGNHDYCDESTPFFGFLKHLSNLTYIAYPQIIDNELFIPHLKNFEETVGRWLNGKEILNLRSQTTVYMHQTVSGAKASNGFELKGIDLAYDKYPKFRFFSGDIHVPQTVSQNFDYVGASYPVVFGDEYDGRVILVDNRADEDYIKSIIYPCPKRYSYKLDYNNFQQFLSSKIFQPYSEIKLKVELRRSELSNWKEIKKLIATKLEDRFLTVREISVSIKQNSVLQRKAKTATTLPSVKSNNTYLKEYSERENLDEVLVQVGSNIYGSL